MPPLSLLFYCFLSDPYADTHENCWVKVDRVVEAVKHKTWFHWNIDANIQEKVYVYVYEDTEMFSVIFWNIPAQKFL